MPDGDDDDDDDISSFLYYLKEIKKMRQVDVTAQCLKQHTAFYHDISGVGLFSKLRVLRESDLKALVQQ